MAILGIDEVGRGPLAGPLVVGAVILPSTPQPWFTDLTDSKKLTPKKRTILSNLVFDSSATGLGWVSASELDSIGITKALELATKRAVKAIQSLHIPFSEIIIDGTINFLKNTPLSSYVTTLIKADSKIREVSAASIIAKVARDNYMINIATKYPKYNFDKHVGYGTKSHIESIYKYGLTPEHRCSFEPCKSLSNFISSTPPHKNTTTIGTQAESTVATFLEQKGHTIITKNHKTYFYEIDIISTYNHHIYFTEVRYRKNSTHGTGLDSITKDKKHRMTFAAESFLRYTHKEFKSFNPILAVASVSGPNFHIDDWLTLTE